MQVGTKEFYEILLSFERDFNYMRLDKEDKSLWKESIVYQDGETNKIYQAYSLGYALGRLNYMQEAPNAK